MMESWDKHSSTNMFVPKEGDMDGGLNARTPSFFQSPSLVCLGGLNVLDPFETVQSVDEQKREVSHMLDPLDETRRVSHVDSTSGWGGLGLHGNHSYTNLAMHRSASGGSGIFIGDDEENEESNDVKPGIGNRRGSWANQVGGFAPEDYIKTSTMANFYYGRKHYSHGNLANGEAQGTDESGRPLSAGQLTGSSSPNTSLRASIR
jgi:hypothetical protein